MDYIELSVPTSNSELADIIIAELSELPFDSFVTEKNMLKAYIPQHLLIDCKNECDDILANYNIDNARYVQIEAQNWNALWESNFEPVNINNQVFVRAPFHQPIPSVKFEIVIMPKMSFGTGHHATTKMMIEMILDSNLKGLNGLDMGSGTGVLSIAACKCGALHVDAVDIDDFAYENCCENISNNGCSTQIRPILGNVQAIEGKNYDFILANINRNILLSDIDSYLKTLQNNGELFMSGFLDSDVETMCSEAAKRGLKLHHQLSNNGWAALSFIKQ